MADVLLISADPTCVDYVLALTSASQLTVEVTASTEQAAQVWLRSVVVVVGLDLLAPMASQRPPHRPEVIVLGAPDQTHWRLSFDIGAEDVVTPPGEPGWLAERVRRAGEQLPAGRVVGVVGCRGGAGASAMSTALAVAAVRRKMTPYLLDLDPLGCGLGVVLGADESRGLTWDQVSAGVGRIPALSLQSTVAVVDGVGLLGWDDSGMTTVAAGVAGAVVETARVCAPVTVIDLGRAITDSQHEALARCDRVLLMVPADVRSVRAARRMTGRQGLSMCEVVVRGPNPGGLVAEDIGTALGLPVLAAVGADKNLDRRMERGEAPGTRSRSPLGRAGDGLLKEILA